MPSQPTAHDNPRASRFEIDVEGQLATAAYQRDGATIRFTHTFVPEPLRGRGLATRMIVAALDTARAAKLEVVPQCSSFAAYMRAHPETRDLLGSEGRALIDVS